MLKTLLLAVLLLCNSASLFAQTAPLIWTVPSLLRVGPTDVAGSGLRAEIAAARGEYESFQIVIQAPESGLTNVDVSISNLQGANSALIPASAFTLYREHYVYVGTSSPDWGGPNRPRGTGWYPDALIPFNDPTTGLPLQGANLNAVPFALAAGFNQPIWVDILVPPTASTGQYSGTFTVSSDQGQSSGEISLRVFNFTLPLKPSLRTSFLVWRDTSLAANEELLRNKVEPLRAEPSLQRHLIDKRGLGSVGLPFWSGADIATCSMASAPSVGAFRSAVVSQQPELWKYVYSADEIDRCPNLYESVKAWARNMHAAGASNLVTMSPTPELYDDGSGSGQSAVDVWVQLPVMYDRASSQNAEVLRKGDRIWSYNTLVQDSYSPKWLIDFSPIDFRIQPGFINQSLGLTGLLYWRTDLWSSDPWNVVNSYGGGNYPGEGVLIYPGTQIGSKSPAPSMRLKWIRDGVEDYEYIQILKNLGYGADALRISRSAASDWHHWTRDPDLIADTRLQLAVLIEQLSTSNLLPPPPAANPDYIPAPQTVNSTPQTDRAIPTDGMSSLVTFNLKYWDPDGAADINGISALINSSVDGDHACWIVFDKRSNQLWLANDDAITWQSAPLASTQKLENNQCFFYPALVQQSTSENAITLSIPVEFKPKFAGTKSVFLRATDYAGNDSGYQLRGQWLIP